MMASKSTKKNAKHAQEACNSPAARAFADLVQEYYDATFERFPVWATSAGVHAADGEMGNVSPATWRRQAKLTGQMLARLENMPLQDFPQPLRLDRRTMLSTLRQAHMDLAEVERWRIDPQTHLNTAADSVYMLVVRHADDLSPVAGDLISRLRKMPRYFSQACECLDKPDPLWQKLAVKAAPAVGGMFTSLDEPLARATGKSLAQIQAITTRAAAAAQDYANHTANLAPGPRGSFSIGEGRLARMIHERLGLGLSPREIEAIARRQAELLNQAMTAEARRFHRRKSAAEIIEEAAAQWQPQGKDLLEAYTLTTTRMRERFQEAGWLTFPKGDRLLIKPVPEFMQDQFPTAAYSPPGPLDPDQTGIFWVNDLSAKAPTPAARHAEIAQHFGLELTCAHEAYPGHHVQFILQNRLPSLARKMAAHSIYYEGWTLWCEQMTADLLDGQDNPYTRLRQLHDELWRAWRIVIDLGLQTGALSYDQACGVLMREVGFTKARAQGDVNWYTSMPTVPMSYLLGKMELLRLKQHYVDSAKMNLCEFNDWILSHGAVPWRWFTHLPGA